MRYSCATTCGIAVFVPPLPPLYKVVEEKLLGFVLVYKLACTELHGSDSFVKCVSRFCVKIRRWSITMDCWSKSVLRTMLSKMFLFFRSSFLSRIQQKKVEGQTFLGFVLLIWLSVYFAAGKTIFRCLISACLHCLLQKKYTYAWFNLISCHSVQREIIKKVKNEELLLAIVLVCKLSCS